MAVSHFDRLFRLIFSTSEAKADLARNVLPSRYLEKIHLESLQSEDASFIDEELKEHFTDILMFFELKEEKNSKHKVPAGQDGQEIQREDNRSAEQPQNADSRPQSTGAGSSACRNSSSQGSLPNGCSRTSRLYLYLLVDHKSRPDRWAPLQLLRYVSTIYKKILRDQEAKNKALPPEQKTPMPKKMPEIIRILVEEVRRLPADSDLAKAIYRVLAAVKERREIEEFLEHARKMRYTDIEEGVMTFAQEVREEGEKIGLEKGETLGKIKEKQNIVKRQLRKKFGLSEEEAAQIDRIEDFEALDGALDEIIDAEDKQTVLDKLGL